MIKLKTFKLSLQVLAVTAVVSACDGSDNNLLPPPPVSGTLAASFDVDVSSTKSNRKAIADSMTAGAWFTHKFHTGPGANPGGDAGYTIEVKSDIDSSKTEGVGDILAIAPGDGVFSVSGVTKFTIFDAQYWTGFIDNTTPWAPYLAEYSLSAIDLTNSADITAAMTGGVYTIPITNQAVGLVTWELTGIGAANRVIDDVTFHFSQCDASIAGFTDYTQVNADFETPSASQGYAYFHALTAPKVDGSGLSWDDVKGAGCTVDMGFTVDGISPPNAYRLVDNFEPRQWYKVSVKVDSVSGSLSITHDVLNDWDEELDADIDLDHLKIVDISTNYGATAELRHDGRVITWGDPAFGGDSSAVEADLVDVESLANTPYEYEGAFAALHTDKTVTTWGSSRYGGNSNIVAGYLVNVESITNTHTAFAAIHTDKTVTSWGGEGGNSSAVTADLVDVESIANTHTAFAAIHTDKTVTAWGGDGGDSSAVDADLVNVESIASTDYAFVALHTDKTVTTWGDKYTGGNSGDLIDVVSITSGSRAFAALHANGTVTAWGQYSAGGDSSAVDADLVDVVSIANAGYTFAALHTDKTVTTWGAADSGGDSSAVTADLVDVVSITASNGAFAALKADGSVIAWGKTPIGAEVQAKLDTMNVQVVVATASGFTAISDGGRVSVSWGPHAPAVK